MACLVLCAHAHPDSREETQIFPLIGGCLGHMARRAHEMEDVVVATLEIVATRPVGAEW